MIANRMCPVTMTPPHTKAEFLITLADKWCAVTEFLGFCSRKITTILDTLQKEEV